MILDTIMFVGYANEVDILEFRLEEYYDIVDNFLIIEGTHTFQGDENGVGKVISSSTSGRGGN